MEELICPECRELFNDYENTPLMLPDCGHTICQKCIEAMLFQSDGQQIICPEDGIIAKGKHEIAQFPKNCQLLKMVIKQRCYGNKEQVSRQSTRNDEDIKFESYTPEYKVQLNNLTQSDQQADICPEHLEKLEIVCLTDKQRICTRCALFGIHRHHEVRSVDDVVKEITSKAEGIMQVYQKIQSKQAELSEQKFYEPLSEKFQKVLQESHQTVKEKFGELHQLLETKQVKLMEQLTTLTQTLESQTKKQIKEIISQSLSSAELWKITAKDRLVYFSTKTESGEIPLDLLDNQEYACVEKGKGILEDLEKASKQLENKLQNVKIKKLRVDLKKTEIDKCFDNLFTLTLQLSNSPKNQNKKSLQQLHQSQSLLSDSLVIQDLKKNESFSRLCGQDFFSSFIQEEPMLLKDMSLADWSETLADETTTTISQVKSPMKQHEQHEDFFKGETNRLSGKKESLTPLKPSQERQGLRQEKYHKTSILQQSPIGRERDQNGQQQIISSQQQLGQQQNLIPPQVNSLRSGISPTPKVELKKRKNFKINEKFEQIWQAFKSDNIEIADFSSAELGDEGLLHLGEIMKISKKVKQLKLVRNKISDDGASKLLEYLVMNQNGTLQSLHLSSNMITERTLDYLLSLIKNSLSAGSLPKNMYMNQTLINATKAKKKIDELKRLGFVVNV